MSLASPVHQAYSLQMSHLKSPYEDCPSGDLPNPGIKPRSPVLQADSLLSEPPGKPRATITPVKYKEMQKHSYSTTRQGCRVGEMPPIQETFMLTEYTPAELMDIGAKF